MRNRNGGHIKLFNESSCNAVLTEGKNSSSREKGGILGDFKIAKDSFVINQISQHFRSHFWHKGAHDAVLFLM